MCAKALARGAGAPDDAMLARSAVVFSPHYDDETLGAGGTIIRKLARGATVHVVFMTDGSRSHAHAIEPARLSAMRRNESLAAMDALGVPRDQVTFLELPETRLRQHRDEAIDRVADLLVRLRSEQVFVPSTLEPLLWSPDHQVTTEVVFRALERVRAAPEVVEYLVWFWYHWPWVSVRRGSDVRQLLRLTWAGRFGLTGAGVLNTAVPVGDVLGQKRAALEAYASQMTRLSTNTPWPVLGDVAQGEFLRCFFQPTELFKRYPFSEAAKSTHR